MNRDKNKEPTEVRIVLPLKTEYSEEEKYKIMGGIFILFSILLIPSLIFTLPSFVFISYIFGIKASEVLIFIIWTIIAFFVMGLSLLYYAHRLSSRKSS